MFRIAGICALGAIACALSPVYAQQTFEPIKLGTVDFSGSIRDRLESWQWFTPTTGDPGYIYNGTTVRFAFSQNLKPFDWLVEFEAPILLNLPDNAVAAGAQGQLGQGATYYVANNKEQNAAMLFPKQVNLRLHNVFGSEFSSLKLGRFEFQDGSEIAPRDPTLALLKRDRIQQRLIGPFTFTDVMRGFDGFHYVYGKPDVNYTFIGAVPTRGVSQVDGWGWIDVAFGYLSMTREISSANNKADWRVFGIYYDDWRSNLTKTDNRSAAAKAADHANIRIFTYGAHFVDAASTAIGTFDMLGEFAGQTGAWGVQTQRAGMFDVEGGFQPKVLPRLKPWLRAGYYYGSGDKDPNDSKHGTFFQILPTARPYARFPFYDMENNVDRFAMVTFRPHPRFTFKSEVHSLRLASRNDLWYTGGGAFQPWSFGYQGRSATGALSLANLYDGNVDINVNAHLVVSPYLGYAAGKSVVRAIYPRGVDGHLAFLEMTYKF